MKKVSRLHDPRLVLAADPVSPELLCLVVLSTYCSIRCHNTKKTTKNNNNTPYSVDLTAHVT